MALRARLQGAVDGAVTGGGAEFKERLRSREAEVAELEAVQVPKPETLNLSTLNYQP